MENETQNEAPEEIEAPQTTSEPTPTPAPEESKNSPYGPIVGIIIIVILIILAGFYFWGGSIENSYDAGLETAEEQVGKATNEDDSDAMDTNETGTDVSDETTGSVGAPLSESNEIEDIEADLDTTDLDSLDAELEDLDAEFTL